MNNEKLTEIIKDKNDKLERQALRNAEELINQIVNEQAVIAQANSSIEELRKELKALEVEQLDATSVLGS